MPRRAKPAPSGRSCRECIHEGACVMQCGGNPMTPSNATRCACYENLRGSNAYFLGMIAGRKEAMQEGGEIKALPAVDAEKMSDGYHTFADLYEQRLILSAALAKNNPHAWKSKRHEDGSVPFGGGWFIMGFDTDEGCYTYHYELKDWDLFQCKELDKGKPWDGHTSKDVRRLLSIPAADGASVVHGQWINPPFWGRGVCACSHCKDKSQIFVLLNGEISEKFCPLCGAKMDGDSDAKTED